MICCVMLCYVRLCCGVVHYVVFQVMLRCVMLWYVALCCAVKFQVMLCCFICVRYYMA